MNDISINVVQAVLYIGLNILIAVTKFVFKIQHIVSYLYNLLYCWYKVSTRNSLNNSFEEMSWVYLKLFLLQFVCANDKLESKVPTVTTSPRNDLAQLAKVP